VEWRGVWTSAHPAGGGSGAGGYDPAFARNQGTRACNNGPSGPDVEVFLRQLLSTEVATKANKWQGRNITRWQNKQFDEVHKQVQVELDPVKRAALIIKLNELLIENVVVIPVVARRGVASAAHKLQVELTGWDNNTWDLANWYREA
jgi:peptide/nickel transport system substrate-binding protein